jgi:hypothetical protein
MCRASVTGVPPDARAARFAAPLPYVIAAARQAGFAAFDLANCTVPALFMH